MSGPITYRRFTDDDIAAAHALSVEVKWPHRADDWRFVTGTGIGCIGFVAENVDGVVGTALSWKYGADTGSLGMVIVSPQHQGKGIGRTLMNKVLDALQGRVVFLNATPSGQPLYEKFGFEAIGTIDQHQGAAFQPPLISLPPGERLRPLGTNDAPRLASLASRASGLDRSVVVPALLDIAEGIALDRDGELLGFALFRRFGRGFAIGPVIAPDEQSIERAKALISYWLALNEGVFVRIDMPGDSGLTDWLEGLGLPRVDTVVKMRRPADSVPAAKPFAQTAVSTKPLPTFPVRQFGITNQALG